MGTSIQDPRAAIGAAPIPGDAPAGSNIRYEPDFAALQDQVTRMDTEGPLAVDWRAVAQTGCDLLATRSKDLLIAAWVALALARTESWRGLNTGLQIIAGMIEHHWPDLEPPAKRERGRVQMLEWTVARVVPLFAEQEPEEAAWPDVIAAYGSLGEIERLLDEKLTKESAALGELTRLLRERARNAERELAARAAAAAVAEAAAAAPTPPAPTPVAPAAAVAAPASAPASGGAAPAAMAMPVAVAAPTNPGEVNLALSRLQGTMQDVARGVQAADAADPRGYALLRAATWLLVAQAPMNTNGVTPLPPPPPERLAYLAGLQQAGDHLGAIIGIEQTFAGAPFWFGAHRMTCASLAALGATHEAARMAVTGATAALLRRVPVLLDLSFSNRTPLADDETRAWLTAEVLASGAGSATGTGDGEADVLRTAGREARKRATAGRVKDGLTTLLAAAVGAQSGRERFCWLLVQAEFCLDYALIAMALSLLDHLDGEVVRTGLEAWEPDLAISVSALMHRCLLHNDAASLRSQDLRSAQLEAHRTRLCRLDIVAAADALKLQ